MERVERARRMRGRMVFEKNGGGEGVFQAGWFLGGVGIGGDRASETLAPPLGEAEGWGGLGGVWESEGEGRLCGKVCLSSRLGLIGRENGV